MAVSEIVRPTAADNAVFTADVDLLTDVNEVTTNPTAGDVSATLMTSNHLFQEQIWTLALPTTYDFRSVSSFGVEMMITEAVARTDVFEVRLQINGVWTEPQDCVYVADGLSVLEWVPVMSFTDILPRRINSLKIGMRPTDVVIASIDVLYVVVNGEDRLVAFDDLAYFDGLESVTLDRRVGENATGTNALRSMLSITEVEASQGHYKSGDVNFHLRQSEVNLAPTIGDSIVDGEGQRFTIVDVQKATLVSRWKCVSRNVAASSGLANTLRIEKATWTKAVDGSQVPTWTLYRTMQGSVYEVSDVPAEGTGRVNRTTHRVALAESLDLDPTDYRIIDVDDKVYKPISDAKGTIGELFTVDAVRDVFEVGI